MISGRQENWSLDTNISFDLVGVTENYENWIFDGGSRALTHLERKKVEKYSKYLEKNILPMLNLSFKN